MGFQICAPIINKPAKIKQSLTSRRRRPAGGRRGRRERRSLRHPDLPGKWENPFASFIQAGDLTVDPCWEPSRISDPGDRQRSGRPASHPQVKAAAARLWSADGLPPLSPAGLALRTDGGRFPLCAPPHRKRQQAAFGKAEASHPHSKAQSGWGGRFISLPQCSALTFRQVRIYAAESREDPPQEGLRSGRLLQELD